MNFISMYVCCCCCFFVLFCFGSLFLLRDEEEGAIMVNVINLNLDFGL